MIPARNPTPAAPLVRSFDTLEAAQAAHQALLQAGVPAGQMALRVIDDEAGPVQGNFVIGNGVTSEGRPPQGVLAGGEVPYEPNFARPVDRGVHLLLVQGSAEGDRHRLEQLLDQQGGVDPNARLPRR